MSTYARTMAPGADLPTNTHLKLAIDDDTGRVIGQIVNRDTGELVRQLPSKEMLRLIALTKEVVGPLVNETV